jgi:hypothetical protein
MEIFRSKAMYYLADFEWQPLSQLAISRALSDKDFKKRFDESPTALRGTLSRSRAEIKRYKQNPNDPKRAKSKKSLNRRKVNESLSFIEDSVYDDLDRVAKNKQNIAGEIREIKGKGFKRKKNRQQVIQQLNTLGLTTPNQKTPNVKPIITSSRPDAKLILPSQKTEAPQDLILPKKKKKKVVTTAETVSKTPTSSSKKGLEGFADSVSKEGFLGNDAPKVATKVKPNRLGLKVLGATTLAGGALYGLNKLRKSRSDKGKTRGRYKR